MNKLFVSAVIFAAFSIGFSELYSPETWFGFRGDSLIFGGGVNDDTTESVYYELIQKNSEGKSTRLFGKTIKPSPEEKEWTIEFTGIKKDVVGKDALWVQETITGSKEKSKLYGPYGFIKTPLIETSDTASAFSGDVKNFVINAGEKYKFAYTENGLIIALGNLENDLTVSLDPANGKTAYLAFSNRIIICKAAEKSISFFYPERNIDKPTAAIQYKIRDWEGEMKVFDAANGKIIFIPWFDLGMKFENGRKFGFMLHENNFAYPLKASQYSPASWGNIILK